MRACLSGEEIMFRHTLDPLFQPQSLLIVSDNPLPVFQALPSGLRAKTTRVDAQPGQQPEFPAALAGVPSGTRLELAVVCMPPLLLQTVLESLEPYRPMALIVMAHEVIDPDPDRTRYLCADWARTNRCALLGPFSFGLQRPHLGLNLSQHPLLAHPGRAALVAQSRTIMAGVLDWADDVHIGFSAAIALGQESVTRLPDVLDYLATDTRTDSIALYLDDIESGREFMSAIRAAASVKPVVVLKTGSANEGLESDLAFDAALRRAGAVRVRYFVQLFSALKVFSYSRKPRGRRVAVFANGEAPAQLVLDMAGEDGPILKARLAPKTSIRLAKLFEPGAKTHNPVVTHQPLTEPLVTEIMQLLMDDDGVDGVLAMLAPDPRSDFNQVSAALAKFAPGALKPVITCFLGDAGMRPIRRRLDDAGTPAFRTPESAANAFGILASYNYNQQLLLQIQPAEPEHGVPLIEQARTRIRASLDRGHEWLEPDVAWALLRDFHIPLHDSNQPSLKPLCVDDIPAAISVDRDAKFGPVVRFGAGGVLGRFAPDQAGADLAPLNYFLARRMVKRSQFWKKLPQGFYSEHLFEQLLIMLELVSDLVSECPEVLSLRIDPIVVRGDVLMAGDIAVQVSATHSTKDPAANGYDHMSVHPYPRRWVQHLPLRNDQSGTLRPIRPDDALALQAFVRSLSEEARYMRFVSMMRELTPRMLSRYTHVDYHRELALVATCEVISDSGQSQEIIIGLAHYLRNPDGRGAEYALVIADNWQGHGLGRRLMSRLIDAAREQGLDYIEGLVLSNNRPMLSLMTSLGMINDPDPDDSSMRRVWMSLETAGA
jgi:acetyltransferase